MTRLVLYVAHPLRPTEAEIAACYERPTEGRAAEEAARAASVRKALQRNIARAERWLSWLRRSFPETTFIAPWIAAVLSGEDDSDPAQREAGLVDACAVIERCDGIVLCGPRVSAGMEREARHARRVWDLTALGGSGWSYSMPCGDTFEYWAKSFEVRR